MNPWQHSRGPRMHDLQTYRFQADGLYHSHVFLVPLSFSLTRWVSPSVKYTLIFKERRPCTRECWITFSWSVPLMGARLQASWWVMLSCSNTAANQNNSCVRLGLFGCGEIITETNQELHLETCSTIIDLEYEDAGCCKLFCSLEKKECYKFEAQ